MTNHSATGLAVTIRCVQLGEGPLTDEPVVMSDLTAVRHETWLRGMRAGALPAETERLACRVVPGKSLSSGVLADYAIELTDGQGRFRHYYTVHSLEQAAQRATKRLLREKILTAADRVLYYLTLPAGGTGAAAVPFADPCRDVKNQGAGAPMRVKRRSEPLVLESASLAALLDASRVLRKEAAPLSPAEEDPSNHLPIFIDEDVWEESRTLVRRGGDLESGAVWTGRLLRDVDSPELFMLIEAVIEARHAEETKYSIQFSGETWESVRRLLEQRRRRLNRPHERILGSVHGHNFLPDADEEGGQACASCDRLAQCPQSSAVASNFDEEWHRTVFAAAPWAVLGVWGWTPRREEAWQVYSLSGGMLASRTIRVLSARAIAGLTSTTTEKGAPST